jgi:hypothetical protein
VSRRLAKVPRPFAVKEFEVSVPNIAFVANRFVDDEVPEKKLVVVALVPVALTKVKFWRVEEPVARKFGTVSRPVVFNVPKLPTVEKNDVVVAAVPVPFTKVKFWRVDELVINRFKKVEIPAVAVSVPVKLADDEIV